MVKVSLLARFILDDLYRLHLEFKEARCICSLALDGPQDRVLALLEVIGFARPVLIVDFGSPAALGEDRRNPRTLEMVPGWDDALQSCHLGLRDELVQKPDVGPCVNQVGHPRLSAQGLPA
eukprot:1595208-Rhodomonas_salina.1